MGITKPWTHLHAAPSTSIQLISNSTHLNPPSPSSFQPPPSSWQWAVSANLGQNIKSSPFWVKNGRHGIFEVLYIWWNSVTKIQFWVNLDPKIQSCPFYQKIGAHSMSRMLIPNTDLDFWNCDPKIYFWANFGQKI